MGGNTRYGFDARDPQDPGAGADPPRNAQTIFGRQFHRPSADADASPPPAPPANPLRITPPPPNVPTAYQPSHSGKTGHPAVAQYHGRRDTSGELVDDEEGQWDQFTQEIRRERWRKARQVLVVVLAAIVSFTLVAVISWRHARKTAAPSQPPAAVAPSPAPNRETPAPAPKAMAEVGTASPGAPAASAVLTAPAGRGGALGAPELPRGHSPAGAAPARPKPAKTKPRPRLDPDAPLPYRF